MSKPILGIWHQIVRNWQHLDHLEQLSLIDEHMLPNLEPEDKLSSPREGPRAAQRLRCII